MKFKSTKMNKWEVVLLCGAVLELIFFASYLIRLLIYVDAGDLESAQEIASTTKYAGVASFCLVAINIERLYRKRKPSSRPSDVTK
ncbi:MAG: hypothetical protein LBS92_07300 [Candidatus Methanoplasma sp.]|jgi:uncharacterized membrane protein (UPF0136 family)|nr:hypothetical protein [Candidatus Methanoplasma sp.]